MTKKHKKVMVEINITDIGKLPPQYFLGESVLLALTNAVHDDVINKGKPVPPGAQPIWNNDPFPFQTVRRNTKPKNPEAIKIAWLVGVQLVLILATAVLLFKAVF